MSAAVWQSHSDQPMDLYTDTGPWINQPLSDHDCGFLTHWRNVLKFCQGSLHPVPVIERSLACSTRIPLRPPPPPPPPLNNWTLRKRQTDRTCTKKRRRQNGGTKFEPTRSQYRFQYFCQSSTTFFLLFLNCYTHCKQGVCVCVCVRARVCVCVCVVGWKAVCVVGWKALPIKASLIALAMAHLVNNMPSVILALKINTAGCPRPNLPQLWQKYIHSFISLLQTGPSRRVQRAASADTPTWFCVHRNHKAY